MALAEQGHAQTVWGVFHPTSQDLWGVASGASPTAWVTVGTGGTVLTSADGRSWEPEVSGTTAWLLAVAWNQASGSPSLWVAVGDAGTILTSPDTVTWTARASGTSNRLNGVAIATVQGNLRYVAVGEAGTICTSPDGINWTASNAGTSNWLRAVAGSSDGFVVGGQNGVVLTSSDGVTFQATSSPTTQNIEAACTIDLGIPSGVGSLFALVGGGGFFDGVRLSHGAVQAWNDFAPAGQQGYFRGVSVPMAVGTGGQVTFQALNYPVPFTATDTFMAGQPPVSTDLYAVAWSNHAEPNVVAVGAGGTICLLSSEPPLSSVSINPSHTTAVLGQPETLQASSVAGATYQWFFNGAPIAGATGQTLTLNSVQEGQVGQYDVTIATANWTASASYDLMLPLLPCSANLIDTSFRSSNPVVSYTSLVPLSDGQVLAVSPPPIPSSTSTSTIVRLNGDGSLDSSYGATFTGGSLSGSLAQPDGRLVIWGTFTAVDGTAVPGVARLKVDGTLDSSFTPPPLPNAYGVSAGTLVLRPDGRFWLWDASNTQLTWQLLTANGAPDPSFGTSPSSLSLGTLQPGAVLSLVGTADSTGGCWAALNYQQHGTIFWICSIFHVDAGGSPDPSVDPTKAINSMGTEVSQLVATTGGIMFNGWNEVPFGDFGRTYQSFAGKITPNGGLQVFYSDSVIDIGLLPSAAIFPDGSLVAALPSVSTENLVLRRFQSDGTPDPNYGGFLYAPGGSIETLLPNSDGKIMVGGQFASLNGFSTQSIARIQLSPDFAATRIANESFLGPTGGSQLPLTMGFVLGGAGGKDTLLRAAGPALANFGVSGYVADPMLALYEGSAQIQSDDDWAGGADGAIGAAAAAVGAFPFVSGSKDAAILTTLTSGSYSMQATAHGQTGTTLTEIYDADAAPSDASQIRVKNLSVLSQCGPQGAVVTAGFVIGGSGAREILLRADGPALASYGVVNAMPDPVFSLYAGTTLIGTSANAGAVLQSGIDPSGAAALSTAAAQQVGAFAIPSGSADAAMVAILPAGAYSIQATSASGKGGNVLLEVYEVP